MSRFLSAASIAANITHTRVVRWGFLPDEPDIAGHVRRVRLLRWQWWLTTGGEDVYGPLYRPTGSWAWAAAVNAAQEPAVIAAACATARRQEQQP